MNEGNDVEFLPGRFRAKGDTIDIFPRSSIDRALRIEIFDDQVEKISEIHPVTLRQTESLKQVWIYTAKPFIVPAQRIPQAIKSIEQELKEKLELIKQLESILSSARKILDIIKKELIEIKEKYGDERRTNVINHGVENFTAEDLIPDEDIIVTITKDGYIKQLAPETFRTQSRGGKGVSGLTTKEEDVVEHFFSTTTLSDILFFTTKGRVFQLKAYDIPKGSRTAKGQAIVNFLQLSSDEKISAALPLSELGDYKFLMMITTKGNIKKVNIEDFSNVRRSGLIAIRLKKDDELEWVKPSSGKDDIILVSSLGQAIRFKES